MKRLIPAGPNHPLRPALGAALGLIFAGLMLALWPGQVGLIGPLGATAVLVFSVPASPFSQPFAVIGGNVLSALTGLAMARLMPDPVLAAGLAVGIAILVMSLARCLHPPGGGMALMIGLAPAAAHGWMFALVPVGLGSALLVLAGRFYNPLTGHSYPHRPVPPPVRPALTGYEMADLDAVLDQADEMFDVSREDLDAIIRAVEARVAERTRAPQK
jgi:CBS domain-containing membrane protein